MIFVQRNVTFVTTLVAVGVFFATTVVVHANTVVRTGETVSIAEEQIIEGDFYSAASKISVSGSIAEDMVAAGGQITINGPISDNAFLVGGSVSIHGTIGDDLRIISGETTIAEPVMGDVLVIGGSVNILSTASISGDLLLFAGEATVEGSVGGDVMGTVGQLRVDAAVAGDVDVTVDQLTLGDRAEVQGSVRYVSNTLVVQSQQATVSGDLVRNDPVLPGSQPDLYTTLIPVLVLLFAVLSWHLVSRKTFNAVVSRALLKSPRPFLFGVLTILLAPAAIVLLLVSMIGSLVGVLLLFVYLMLFALSLIAAPAVLGRLLMTAFNQPSRANTLLSLSVGVLVVALFMLLPVLGQLVFLALMLLSVGAVVDLFLRPTNE